MTLPTAFPTPATSRQIGVKLTLFSSAAQIHGLRDIATLKRAVGSFSDLVDFVMPYHPEPPTMPYTRQYMQMMASGRCRVPVAMREAFQAAIYRAIITASGGAWLPVVRVTARGKVRVTLRRLCRDCGKPFIMRRGTDRRCGRCRG